MSTERACAWRWHAAWLAALLGCGAVARADDTPELLAAMQAALPPLPETVPHYEELPAQLRARMPPVDLGMHRWHGQPASRFVMIGGRRVHEGGVAGLQLWLREIRRDGVVLQYGDTIFFLPR